MLFPGSAPGSKATTSPRTDDSAAFDHATLPHITHDHQGRY